MKKQSEKPFTKVYAELVAVHVPLRAASFYGLIEYKANEYGGAWWVKHSEIAKLIGLKSRRQVVNIGQLLERLKLVEVTRGQYKNRYRPLVPDVQWISSQICNPLHISDVKSISHNKREKSSSREKAKREEKQNPQPPYPPSPTARTNAANAKSATEQPRPNANAQTNAAAFSNPSLDDDENATQPPEVRFRERLLRRGHDRDPDTLIRNIRKELEAADLSFAEYLDFDTIRTTNPAAIFNPPGHYRKLARELAVRQRNQSFAAAFRSAAEQGKRPEYERDSKGNCVKCGGSGIRAEGGFCDACPTGRDLARYAQRKPSALEIRAVTGRRSASS